MRRLLCEELTCRRNRWRASNNVAEVTLEKGTQLLTLKFLKQAKGTINVQYIEFVPKPAAQ